VLAIYGFESCGTIVAVKEYSNVRFIKVDTTVVFENAGNLAMPTPGAQFRVISNHFLILQIIIHMSNLESNTNF